jgi:restriction system protein
VEIPTYDQFVFPLLRVLAAHPDGIRARDAYEAAADRLGLSPEARSVLLPSGLQTIYQNRIGWAHDRLKRQGLSISPKRGEWRITAQGLAYLAAHPDGIDEAELRELTHYQVGSKATPGQPESRDEDEVVSSSKRSPEERIDSALTELNESLAQEILDMIQGSPPAFFERMVLDVLHAMGYGSTQDDLEVSGGSGDGGIDGVVTLDRLGLEKVFVQAKRWFGHNVGRPDIQSFYGALAGRRARKGVFITTSDFTAEARSFAAQMADSIVLVDGSQLTAFMIQYGVGVTNQRTIKIGRVDSDYFDLS